jgi:hypothetical protein
MLDKFSDEFKRRASITLLGIISESVIRGELSLLEAVYINAVYKMGWDKSEV